jgi:hypothetical protein
MGKTLVLFVFHVINERVTNFINNSIFYDDNVDFIIISNNKNNKFNAPNYVKQIIHRDNIGYDFGGWSEALLLNNQYINYEKFIFVNSSVIGPFLSSNKEKWTDKYINGLQNNIKLFGSTINTCNKPLTHSHVQSYIFAMDKITLDYLIKCEIFSKTNYAKTFEQAIWQKEVLMSRKIIECGWNIGSLMNYYNYVDFTFLKKKPSEYKIFFFDDIINQRHYNSLWKKEELVFIKGNRGIIL